MKEMTIETASEILSQVIHRAVVEGKLTIAAAQGLNFLTEKAKTAEILSARVKDLELNNKN